MQQHVFRFLALFVFFSFSLPVYAFGMEKGGAAPQDNPALQSTLSYEGATSMAYSLIPDLARAFLTRSGVAFSAIGEGGAGAGFNAVIEGRVSMAGIARALRDNEKAAVAAWQIIGFDALGLYVHSSNPVNSLTRAELKEIYSGRITNWKDVGGANLPITVYTERLDSGRATLAVVREVILEGEPYGPVREREDPVDYIWAVEENPGGITFATRAIPAPGVKLVAVDGILPDSDNVASGRYLLSRPIVLVTMMPSGNVRKFFEFVMTPEGQAIVARNFVPTR